MIGRWDSRDCPAIERGEVVVVVVVVVVVAVMMLALGSWVTEFKSSSEVWIDRESRGVSKAVVS